jgi:hypothetical protein
MNDFCSIRTVKSSRKPHYCEQCGKQIPVGSSYVYGAGVFDGDFGVVHEHSDCREAWVYLHSVLLEANFYDRWDFLLEVESDSMNEAVRADIAEKFPAVAARLWGVK